MNNFDSIEDEYELFDREKSSFDLLMTGFSRKKS